MATDISRNAILIASGPWDPEPWAVAARAVDLGRPVFVWPDLPDPPSVRYVMAWHPPEAALAALPNLDVIFSLGAGVEHILSRRNLPDVPVARIVSGDLTARMTEWVTLQVLMHHRQQRHYDRLQRAHRWHELRQPAASEVRVGVMGMGEIGRDAAEVLVRLGFQVAGWSRRPKAVEGVTMHHGAEGLDALVASSDILVAMMPLTADTAGILNATLFAKLPKAEVIGGPVLINVGRGGLQNEADILAALESGKLGTAILDVFQTEPLPEDSPLWSHPNVTVTPHNSAISSPPAIAAYVAGQIKAHLAGEPLVNVVDPRHGY